MSQKGMFLVLEGVDSTGKSTQIDLFVKKLRENTDREVVVTREPGDAGVIGSQIRDIMVNTKGIDPKTRLFLMYADRIQHIKDVIQPALDSGKIVICDRFYQSSFAYQGRYLGIETIDDVHHQAIGFFDYDFAFYLHLDIDVWSERKKARQEDPDGEIESSTLEFMTQVIHYYYDFGTEDDRGIVIDANQSRENVAGDIWKAFCTAAKSRGILRDDLGKG